MNFADRKGSVGTSASWLHMWPRRYGIALIAVAAATLLRYALNTRLGPNLRFFLFYVVIWLVAWMVGLGPGVFAVALSAASANYLFGSANSSALGLPLNANGLVFFIAAGMALSGVADRYRRRGERLREFKRAVDGLEEMIAVVDRDYRYVIANRALLKHRGMKKQDLIGRRISEMLPSGVFEAVVKEKLDECFQGKIVRYEMRYTYPDQVERDLSISYFPITGPDGVERVAGVLQDVTD